MTLCATAGGRSCGRAATVLARSFTAAIVACAASFASAATFSPACARCSACRA